MDFTDTDDINEIILIIVDLNIYIQETFNMDTFLELYRTEIIQELLHKLKMKNYIGKNMEALYTTFLKGSYDQPTPSPEQIKNLQKEINAWINRMNEITSSKLSLLDLDWLKEN